MAPRPPLLVTALTLASTAASAQTAPWLVPPDPGTTPAELSPATPTTAAPWPHVTPRAPTLLPAPAMPRPPREPVETSGDHHFQLPTARLLRVGDLQGHYIGHLGWVGLRYGLTRVIDVGVGIPFYFVGVSVDARVGIVQRPGVAVSWWAYATVPFKPAGDYPTSNLGFTWAYAGLGWLTGPLVSVWFSRVGIHVGAHAAQRTGLGGLWFVGHVTVDVRLTASLKVIAQSLCMYEVAEETADGARGLLGNGAARLLPYALGGVRFHTRRFAADLGVLVPLTEQAPLHSDSLVVLPWMSLSHLF